MYPPDSQLTASQVLRTFHHDELYLFLGAAFTTFGLMSAAFSFLRRKFDPMLFWLALFAILYGQRLWLQSGLLTLMVPPSLFFSSLKDSSNYLVPIPAFFYFEASGFLGRYGRKIAIALTIPFLCLFVGTILFGPQSAFKLINNLIVILTLVALIVQSLRQKNLDRDFVIVRRGIAVFVAFALFDNITQAFGYFPYKEPLGFAFFLGTLGYVAAKRSLERDHQFNEIQKELEIARRIQTSILPRAYPDSDHFTVAARYVPMTSVAGDFYDFLLTDPQQAGLLIADVSGHGVPAALIASMVKLAATSQRANAADPATLLSGMNTVLHGNTQEQFVTAAYVYLDAASSTLRYSAAAHPPMLLLRRGSVVELTENGLMLAAFSFATYSTVEYPLEPGDRLVLYTDGLLEAANATGEEFGPHRLSALLKDVARLNPEAAADHIISSLQTWSKSQNDDLTVLICDYAGFQAA
ncbi:MAG: Serine phosphatase RsbU, regulator of sigma subunit [Edaphobacter sp.]|nr:Serine phosphatase RsbU, regulator of sigma subunit [Edaphobacter sp.]